MNVKYEDTARRAIKHRSELLQENKQDVPVHLRAYKLIVNSDKHKSLNPMAASYENLTEKITNETEEEQERCRNRPYTGAEGTKAYTMPPWPPNSTNLEAFKNLLLNRKMLIIQAGGLYVEGKIEERGQSREGDDGGNYNREDSDDDEETGSVIPGTESSGAQHVAIVPQQNAEGPIVITNQMDRLVNVAIKAEGSARFRETQLHAQPEIIYVGSDATSQGENNATVNGAGTVPFDDNVTLVNDTIASVAVTDSSYLESGVQDTIEVPDVPVVIEPQPSTSQEGLENEGDIQEVIN